MEHITAASTWELPRDLLRRQARRAMGRKVMEMRADGISEEEIQGRRRLLEQDILESTALSLKEHFVLQKIAEVEKIDVNEDDLNDEIERMAKQNGESPRRVRARLEREDLLEALAAEMIERKALDLILDNAEYEDVPLGQEDQPSVSTVEAQAVPGEMTRSHGGTAGGGRDEPGVFKRVDQFGERRGVSPPVDARTGGLTPRRSPAYEEFAMWNFDHPMPHDPRNQRYREYTRQRQYGTNDILLDNRIIFFGCSSGNVYEPVITDMTANLVIQQMLYLQYENRNQEIHFYINSPGGSVTATLAIYDTMQFLECPIATYCMGIAASGAAILLAAGTKGKRFALPHAKVMIHQPWSQGIGGQASDVEIEMKEILKEKKRLNEILAHHTGRPLDQIEAETERNRYFTATEAKEFGLVDEVLTKMASEKKS